MGQIVALVNHKGGSGKTTSALHLAAALARRDWRVLVVDLDPQGHAALGFGIQPLPEATALSDVLAHTPLSGIGPGLAQTILSARPGIDLIPANLGLATLEVRLAGVPGREERLAEHLAEIGDVWDLVLIDSPPNLGLLTINALMAAEEVILPFDPSPFSFQSLMRVLDTIRLIGTHKGRALLVHLLATMVPQKDRWAQDLVERVRSEFPGLVLQQMVRRSPLFPRAASVGKSVGELSDQAPAWQDYLNVANHLAGAWRQQQQEQKRFRGLVAVDGGVEFSHPDLEPQWIQLAGDFNGWVPDKEVVLTKQGPRRWIKFLSCPPGRFEYKFIVRGEWHVDPVNPRRVSSGLGTENSVIEVLPPRPRVNGENRRRDRPEGHA